MLFGGKQRRAEQARKGSLGTDPRDSFYKKLPYPGTITELEKGGKAKSLPPSPELRETRSKASVEERPLQDKSCSVPPDQLGRNVSL